MSKKLSWHMSIREVPHDSGISYPVFEWSYGFKEGFRGGELRAWPIRGELVFRERREQDDSKFHTVEKALVKINEYGWGKPPHLDEVFQIMLATKAQLPAKGLENAKKIFNELRQKWQALINPLISQKK